MQTYPRHFYSLERIYIAYIVAAGRIDGEKPPAAFEHWVIRWNKALICDLNHLTSPQKMTTISTSTDNFAPVNYKDHHLFDLDKDDN
jgi:hypothetical protein